MLHKERDRTLSLFLLVGAALESIAGPTSSKAPVTLTSSVYGRFLSVYQGLRRTRELVLESKEVVAWPSHLEHRGMRCGFSPSGTVFGEVPNGTKGWGLS